MEPTDQATQCGVTRRGMLGAVGATAALLALNDAKLSFAAPSASSPSAKPPVAGRVLISVFLRGGADGLSLVPPVGDPAYAQLRPNISIPAASALHLDRTFGLHPSMKSLLPFYRNGNLAVVHAVGDPKGTRSHFEMQDAMEREQTVGDPARAGWIADWLQHRSGGPGKFPSVAIGSAEPTSLEGGAPAVALNSVDAFALLGPTATREKTARALARMHSHARPDIAEPAMLALEISKRLAPYQGKPYVPLHGAVYPQNPLSFALSQLALLMRAGVGLTAAALDFGGWDTHTSMGRLNGTMATLAQTFADSLAAFATDLGSAMANVTVLTMTEFGRTAAENGSGGTDHGVASSMFLLGRTPPEFPGGRVHARWPGLAVAQKDPNADLEVTTDYRTVLTAATRAIG